MPNSNISATSACRSNHTKTKFFASKWLAPALKQPLKGSRWFAPFAMLAAVALLVIAASTPVQARVWTAHNVTELANYIQEANFNGDDSNTINLDPNAAPGTFDLTRNLPVLGADNEPQKTLIINGNDNTIDGKGQYRIFFANAGRDSSGGGVVIKNVTLTGGLAEGGDGGDGAQGGGGGGLGAGGALFVRKGADVQIENVKFDSSNKAQGGDGGTNTVAGGGGGGGGISGDGGDGASGSAGKAGGGGGGGGSIDNLPDSAENGSNGNASGSHANGGDGGGDNHGAGGSNADGNAGSGTGRGGGGGGGSDNPGTTGHDGGDGGPLGGGGGGAGKGANGGDGGFGGGGGGASGNGGPGGGGGGGSFVSEGGKMDGNNGGGNGNTGGGGGGAAYGGQIFVQEGGTLTIVSDDGAGTDSEIDNGDVIAGTGGGPSGIKGGDGNKAGKGIYIQGNSSIVFDGDGKIDVKAFIAAQGEQGDKGQLIKNGSGTVTLSGTKSTDPDYHSHHFHGDTLINEGYLSINADEVLTADADVYVNDGATFELLDGHTQTIQGLYDGDDGAGTVQLDPDTSSNDASLIIKKGEFNGKITGDGSLTKISDDGADGGTLILTNQLSDYTGGTTIEGGAIQIANQGAIGSGGLTLDGGALKNTDSVTFTDNFDVLIEDGGGTFNTDGGDMVIKGQIKGDGSSDDSLTKVGSGTLDLTKNDDAGGNNYKGGTFINEGTIKIDEDSDLGDLGGEITFDGGALETTEDLTATRAIHIKSNGGTFNVDDGTTLTVNSTIDSSNSSGASLTKEGEGTLDLSGQTNTYSGGTIINAGTVKIDKDNNLGLEGGDITFDGGILENTSDITFSDNGEDRKIHLLTDGGTFNTDSGTELDIDGKIDGTGKLTKIGEGTLILSGTNDYSGGTNVLKGILQGDSDSLQGAISTASGATVEFDQPSSPNSNTYAGVLSGNGTVVVNGDGSSTGKLVLSGANTYTGGTTVTAGTLQGTTDSLQGDIHIDNTNTTELIFNQDSDGDYADAIDGGSNSSSNLYINKDGSTGAVTFSGDSSNYSGNTTVNSGSLIVNGKLGSDGPGSSSQTVTVGDGTNEAVLGGTGSIGGNVTVKDNAILDPGSGPTNDALDIDGDLTLTASTGSGDIGATTKLNLIGGTTDSVNVAGQLTEGGNILLDVDSGGVYTLFTYGSTTGSFDDLNYVNPGEFLQSVTDIDSSSGKVTITLQKTSGSGILFWNGSSNTGSTPQGGSGTWDSTKTNWIDENGTPTNVTWQDGAVAVFGGANGGQVSVDGEQKFATLQFKTDDYTLNPDSINGGALTIAPASGDTDGIILVDNGKKATINTTIQDGASGDNGLKKESGGTLILGGANTYSGGTEIAGGILQISNDNNLGAEGTDITLSGGTLQVANNYETDRAVILDGNGAIDTNFNNVTLDSAITGTGTGTFTKKGDGTLTLTKASGYAGNTVVTGGTLKANAEDALVTGNYIVGDSSVSTQAILDLGSNGNLVMASLSGDSNNAEIKLGDNNLIVNQDDNTSFDGVISGSGSFGKTGSGILTLNSTSSYTGDTVIEGSGGIKLGTDNAITAGSYLGLQNGATLDLNDHNQKISEIESDSGTTIKLGTGGKLEVESGVLAGNISDLSNGQLDKSGNGTLTLLGTNTYQGATTINGGTLALMSNSALPSNTDVTVGDGTNKATLNIGLSQVKVNSLNVKDGSVLAVTLGDSDNGKITIASGNSANLADDSISLDFANAGNTTFWDIVTADSGKIIYNNSTDSTLGYDLSKKVVSISGGKDALQVKIDNTKDIDSLDNDSYVSSAWKAVENTSLGSEIRGLPEGAGAQAKQIIRDSLMPEQVGANVAAANRQGVAMQNTLTSYMQSRRSGQPTAMQSASLSNPLDMQLASSTSNPMMMANLITSATDSNDFSWNENFNSTNNGSAFAPWGQPKNAQPQSNSGYGNSAASSEPSRWGGFAVGYGIFTNLDTTDSSLGGKASTYAGQFGVDYKIDEHWLAGIGFTYASGKIDYKGGRGKTDMDTYRIGPYFSYTNDNWFVNGSLTYAIQPNDMTRVASGNKYKASYDANSVAGYVGGGFDITVGDNWHVTPNVGITYSHSESDGYTEKQVGGGTGQKVGKSNFDSLRTNLGVNLSFDFDLDKNNKLVPFAGIGWSRENLDTYTKIDVQNVGGGGSPFTINPTVVDRNNFYYNIGLSAILKGGLSLSIRYNGNSSSNSQTNAVVVSASFPF